MKNHKDSLGEDNNFKIGIVPNSRVRRTKANEEDLKFLMCFDYYKNNLIVEDDGKFENLNYNFIEEEDKSESGNSRIRVEIRHRPEKIQSHHRSKIKLIKKSNFNNRFDSNCNLNKKEFFKIKKSVEDNFPSECQKELLNIVNENQQFMNIYTKDEEIEENIKSIFDFLNTKTQNQDVLNIMNLFDLPNFIKNMENTLKMWNLMEVEDINS